MEKSNNTEIKNNTDDTSEEIKKSSEKRPNEKLIIEKANLESSKNLYLFLKNTKTKGTNYQKEILRKVFKIKH